MSAEAIRLQQAAMQSDGDKPVTMDKTIATLGTRGIPACHGGFETFAERLALYLVERGWHVTVYCQGLEGDEIRYEDLWNGVHRIVIPVRRQGALGTMEFDWQCVRD